MPVPFRDADGLRSLGNAGFLKMESPGKSEFRGALFLINAYGDPIEFNYNGIELPYSFLWNPVQMHRQAHRRLLVSLLQLCQNIPTVLCYLSLEMDSGLFREDIRCSIPVCGIPVSSPSPDKTNRRSVPGYNPFQDFEWIPAVPDKSSREMMLVDQLVRRDLILEPFERASIGLQEIFRPGKGS